MSEVSRSESKYLRLRRSREGLASHMQHDMRHSSYIALYDLGGLALDIVLNQAFLIVIVLVGQSKHNSKTNRQNSRFPPSSSVYWAIGDGNRLGSLHSVTS